MWSQLAPRSSTRLYLLTGNPPSMACRSLILTCSCIQRTDVVTALHANEHKEAWIECNSQVGGQLRNRKTAASISIFPDLLKKIPILLFAGDQDYICNHVGMEKLIANLEWNGGKGMGVRC